MKAGTMPRLRREGAPHRPLFQKYFVAFFAAVLVPLFANGASEAWFGYQDQRAMIDKHLTLEAARAADQIQNFLDGITDQLGWTVQLPAESALLQQRRLDARRLLRQVPAITEISQTDQDGKEQLRVSRLTMDVVGSGTDRSADPAVRAAAAQRSYYGPVYFRRASEPYMTIAIAGVRRSSGVSIAEVNLKLIWEVISNIKVGKKGEAFVVGSQNRLIAHPDISLVLRGDAASNSERIRRLLLATADSSDEAVTVWDADGRGQIAAMASIAGANWMVFVQQPLSEAFAPIYAALWRTGGMLVAGTAFAALLAYLLARRMMGPIRLLEEGAEQIGAGHFEHRINFTTGDELERLANRFNEMAGELAVSQERSQRIARLKQFLAPQVAELIEKAGQETLLESQRREVVAIFCDLRNFTAFSAQAGPEEIMGVLSEYYSALGPIITKHEATQTSFSGDGLMILLNAPVPCETPALRAIRIAIEMQHAIQELALGWREQGHAIGFGVGLAKGPATVGRIGYEGRVEYTAIGHVVNLAARLCSTALDGQILMDANVASEAGNAVPVEALGSRQLKGIEEQVPIYAVIRASDPPCFSTSPLTTA